MCEISIAIEKSEKNRIFKNTCWPPFCRGLVQEIWDFDWNTRDGLPIWKLPLTLASGALIFLLLQTSFMEYWS